MSKNNVHVLVYPSTKDRVKSTLYEGVLLGTIGYHTKKYDEVLNHVSAISPKSKPILMPRGNELIVLNRKETPTDTNCKIVNFYKDMQLSTNDIRNHMASETVVDWTPLIAISSMEVKNNISLQLDLDEKPRIDSYRGVHINSYEIRLSNPETNILKQELKSQLKKIFENIDIDDVVDERDGNIFKLTVKRKKCRKLKTMSAVLCEVGNIDNYIHSGLSDELICDIEVRVILSVAKHC